MWFFNKVPNHLPKATGSFIPGIADVMLDYDTSGIFMRIYYPTDEKITIESKHKKWAPTLPDHDYISGISDVIIVPTVFINIGWVSSGRIQIPALYGEKAKTDKKLKCIILSHGLGALRSFYSGICIELASRGYLVAVIEHRDESACHTYYFASKEDAQANNKTIIPFKKVRFGKGHYEVRKEQVEYRTTEFIKALDFLINLNKGTVPNNVFSDVPSEKDNSFNLSDFIGKIDIDNIGAGGHSFGAVTALMALAQRKELKYGIILDPWMYPVKAESLHTKIDQPLLFINTQTFHIETNIKALKPFMEEGTKHKMYTILKSTHENQTDSVFIVGYWLNWFMRKIDPKIALLVNNALILEFLNKHANNDENVSDMVTYLGQNSKHYAEGLTKPWA